MLLMSHRPGRRAIVSAFSELGVDRVCSVILPENIRSIAVVRRLGFRRGAIGEPSLRRSAARSPNLLALSAALAYPGARRGGPSRGPVAVRSVRFGPGGTDP
jgi:hypothetical protein